MIKPKLDGNFYPMIRAIEDFEARVVRNRIAGFFQCLKSIQGDKVIGA